MNNEGKVIHLSAAPKLDDLDLEIVTLKETAKAITKANTLTTRSLGMSQVLKKYSNPETYRQQFSRGDKIDKSEKKETE